VASFLPWDVRMTNGPGEYPKELEQQVVLPDGARVFVRPIRPDDADRLVALYDRLSQHTAYQRFFQVMRRLPPDWARFLATVDYVRRLALVAVDDRDPEGKVIAVARYEPMGPTEAAEVAFVVQDAWQNRGLGTFLFCTLLEAARARGIDEFQAMVLADDHRILDLITRLTHVHDRRIDSGVVELRFRVRARADPVSPASRARRSP
jgi:RimJ/RimL family protein N-acetyltransferase